MSQRLSGVKAIGEHRRIGNNDALLSRGGLGASVGYALALGALGLSFFANLDPSAYGFGAKTGVLRYLPSAMMSVSLLVLLSVQGIPAALRSVPVLCGVALMLLTIGGSSIWIAQGGHSLGASFLGRGLSMIALLVGVAAFYSPGHMKQFSRRIAAFGVALAAIGFAMMSGHSLGLLFPNNNQVLHVEMVYFTAAFAWLAMRYPFNSLRVLIVVLLVANGVLSGKSTFYLLALTFAGLTFGNAIVTNARRLRMGMGSGARSVFSLLLIVAIMALISLAILLSVLVIAERSTRYEYDFRRRAFTMRWEEFKDNPFFGEFFAMPANLIMNKLNIVVPSHNDILDLMAGGGTLALLLFLGAMIPAIVNRIGIATIMGERNKVGSIHFYWFLLVFYAVAAMGNPFLADPYRAVPVWFSAGFMIAWAWHAKRSTMGVVPRARRAHGMAQDKGVQPVIGRGQR